MTTANIINDKHILPATFDWTSGANVISLETSPMCESRSLLSRMPSFDADLISSLTAVAGGSFQ